MPDLHVDVFFSGIWQMTSTVIMSGRNCLVVDPGYFPRELADIAARIPKRATVGGALLHPQPLGSCDGAWDFSCGTGVHQFGSGMLRGRRRGNGGQRYGKGAGI